MINAIFIIHAILGINRSTDVYNLVTSGKRSRVVVVVLSPGQIICQSWILQ